MFPDRHIKAGIRSVIGTWLTRARLDRNSGRFRPIRA